MKTPVISLTTPVASFLLISSTILFGLSGCVEKSLEAGKSFAISGADGNLVMLFGKPYTVSLLSVDDQRCTLSLTGLGQWGLNVTLLIKSNEDGTGSTCKTDIARLFFSMCSPDSMAIENVFSQQSSLSHINVPVFDYRLGIYAASPSQQAGQPKSNSTFLIINSNCMHVNLNQHKNLLFIPSA